MKKFPKKFSGEIGFHSFEEVNNVDTIIFRSSKDVVVEFSENGWLYTVTMLSDDGITFSGHYIARQNDKTETGQVSATLFSAGKEKLLFGQWIEDGGSCWWALLNEVSSFEK